MAAILLLLVDFVSYIYNYIYIYTYPTYNTDMGMRNCLAHFVVAVAEETTVTVPRKRIFLKERRFKSVIHQEVSKLPVQLPSHYVVMTAFNKVIGLISNIKGI